MRASPPSPSRTKIVGDAVLDTRFNIPSRRAGPACPAEKCVPGGGTHGSRPTGAYPQKNNAAPLAGRRAFSVHVSHRRRRVIFAAFTSGNRGGNQPKLFNRNISPAAVLHTIAVMTLVFSSTTRSGGADCHLYTLMD